MTMPSDTTVTTWIELARAYGRAMATIEQALTDHHLPPLSWYDLLLELERAGEAGLRQFELEDALLLRQYSVSRLAERLENEGYLWRKRSAEDGRGKYLIITDKGKHLRQRMWQGYGAKIEEAVGKKLSPGQCHTLSALLSELSR